MAYTDTVHPEELKPQAEQEVKVDQPLLPSSYIPQPKMIAVGAAGIGLNAFIIAGLGLVTKFNPTLTFSVEEMGWITTLASGTIGVVMWLAGYFTSNR